MIDLSTLQTERNAWVADNFPDAPEPQTSILGCIEEVGETAHHWLKRDQKIRGTEEEHTAQIEDGLGDLVVYLAGLASFVGCDYQECWENALLQASNPHDPVTALVALAKAVAVNPRGHVDQFDVEDILCAAITFSRTQGIELMQTTLTTWEKVKQRNWVVNPETGQAPSSLHTPPDPISGASDEG